MISLDKSNGSCNADDNWSTNIYAPSETKDVNFKAFHTIPKINEFKILIKHISCDFKWKFDSTTINSNKKWNDNKRQCECIKYPIFIVLHTLSLQLES